MRLSMAALATQVEHFGLISALAQKEGAPEGGDYKALVCIFLNGGNDGNNMVVPNHNSASVSNYTAYTNVRGASGLAIGQSSLLPIAVPRMGGLTYGLHPNMPELQTLWTQQKLAIVTNVARSCKPITRTTYQNNTVPKPCSCSLIRIRCRRRNRPSQTHSLIQDGADARQTTRWD